MPKASALLDAPVRSVVIETEGMVLLFVGFSAVVMPPSSFSSSGPAAPRRHPRVKLKQPFEPLGIITKTPADVDTLQQLIILIMGATQIVGHAVRIVQIGDRCREVRFAGQQDVLGTKSEIGFVLMRQHRYGKVFQPSVLEYR